MGKLMVSHGKTTHPLGKPCKFCDNAKIEFEHSCWSTFPMLTKRKKLSDDNQKYTITLYKNRDYQVKLKGKDLDMSSIYFGTWGEGWTVHPVPSWKTIWEIIKYFITHKFDGNDSYYKTSHRVTNINQRKEPKPKSNWLKKL